MKLVTTAPNRIDLAGGTLDIYPLYLFEEGGITVNAAIGVKSTVTVRTRADQEIHLYSEDTKQELSAKNIDSLPMDRQLGLVARIVRHYRPRTGIDIITKNDAPKGSGLGASSALLIALSGALNRLDGDRLTKQEIIQVGANLEAQCIGIPTGKQDYYAAMYGAVNAIWFRVDRDQVEPIPMDEETLEQLERSIILSFTGEPHFSAVTNWGMLKAYIEKQGDTVGRMRQIKQTALAMRQALLNADIRQLANLINEEWDNRRKLADGVSTPQIERIMTAARQTGAWASKICGAGGGGCMITLAPPERRDQVINAIRAQNAEVLPFAISREGLTIEVD